MQELPAPVAVAPPAKNIAPGPKIEVRTLSVKAGEKKAAPPPAPEMTSEQAKTDADANNAEAQAQAKKRAEDAGKLLKEYHIEPRVVLRLLTDGGGVAGALEGQMHSEIEVLGKRRDLNLDQKQKMSRAIQEKYGKLIEYTANREESTREQMKKLETSQKPEDKALILDIKSARAQLDQITYQVRIDEIDNLLGSPNLPDAVKIKYETYKKELNKKITEIEDLVLVDLKNKRAEIRSADGRNIPNIIEEMAIAVTGGEVEGIKKAKENPVKHIQETMITALTTEGGVAKLADNLEKANILEKADKEKFIKDMELSLTKEEMKEMAKNVVGKTAIGFLGVLSVLGYMAYKKSQEHQMQ